MAAEWKPYTIAAAGDIQKIADSAEALATTVKETLTLANLGMEAVKLLAQLQTINPLLIALDKLAEEILKEIQNIKEAGLYYLLIDPYYKPNVTPAEAFTYGFQQVRNKAGVLMWRRKLLDIEGDWTGESSEEPTKFDEEGNIIFPTKANLDKTLPKDEKGKTKDWAPLVEPILTTPRKLIPGGYNTFAEDATIDPLKMISPYPQFSANNVINEFVKAFEDEGDVPRYAKNPLSPPTGTIVYDSNGDAFSGWDKTKEFGLELYDMGKDQIDGSIIVDESMMKDARKPINTRISSGKPNILGQTAFDGGSAAVAIVLAAPSFNAFTDIFNAFSKMFSDIPEMSAVGKSMLDKFSEILTPNNVTVKLTQCDTDYGKFEVGDVIGGYKYGGQAEVVSINAASIVATTMSTTKEIVTTTDNRELLRYTEVIDANPDERWVDMEIVAKPIRSVDGLNSFMVGDDVFELIKQGEGGIGDDLFPNYVIKGQNTTTMRKGGRVYPKCAKVAMEKLAELPKSTGPDFVGRQIKDIIPMWGEFFQSLENFVRQLQGMISDSAAFIKDMIDMIKGIEKFLEDLVKTIEEFLKFFSITLPSAGVYALHIPDQSGGNDGIKNALRGAQGLPDHDYAAGILFVGTSVGGTQPIDQILARALGLTS